MFDIPTSYCEQITHAPIEVLNVLSNASFIFFALLAFYSLRRQKGVMKFVLPLLLMLIGLGSAFWHSGHSTLGDITDTFFIIIFSSVIIVLFLQKLLHSRIIIFVTFFILLAVILITEQLNYFNGSLPYIILLATMILIGIFHIKKFSTSKNLFVSSIFTFLIAIIFRSIDLKFCTWLPTGTHFLWHILVAALGHQLILLVTKDNTGNKE